MARTAKLPRLNARPRPIGRGLRGRGWEKGLSPELRGPGFQGGSGRPCRIQLWSPAADPLLTCTKSTKFMDNCQGLLRSPFSLFTNNGECRVKPDFVLCRQVDRDVVLRYRPIVYQICRLSRVMWGDRRARCAKCTRSC